MAILKRKQSKLRSFLKKGLIAAAATLVLLEVLLRLFGYDPYNVLRKRPIEVHGKKSVVSDPILGYRNNDGAYTFKYPSGSKFQANHDSLGVRLPNNASDPDISFYGCSFTYGYGVNDAQTYPYFVGELTGKSIRNAGCNGYGLAQAYLKMKEDFELGIVPKVTVISYAFFQDERTECAPSWQQELFTNGIISIDKNIRIPYVSKAKAPLRFQYIYPKRHYSSISEHSSIWYRVEKLFLTNNDEEKNQEIAVFVLREFQKLCDQYESRLIVVGLLHDPATKSVLKKMEKQGTETCQFDIDVTKPKYNLLPDDGHPSPEAYRKYAEKLLHHLK